MAEAKFELADKAEALYFSIFDITTNRKHYPVKFQRLSTRLQDYALDIHGNILDANSYRTDIPEQKAKRIEYQTNVITTCNKVLSLVKYSLNAHLISFATSEKWVSLTHDIKNITLAWRKNTNGS